MRPNILFIMADQLAAQVLPAYGHLLVKTPNLDRLAQRGVVFDNAYCNYPIWAPARFALHTGRLATRIGAYDNAAELPAETPTFLHYLRAMGYRTCLSGKMHFVGPDQLHGYEERVTTDVYPSDFTWTADWSLGEDTWVPWYHSMRAVLDAGVWRRNVNVEYDDEVEVEAQRWLHDHADSNDPRPFFLTASFISPHDPYLAPQRYWDRYAGVDIDPPRVADIPPEQRDAHSRRLFHVTGRHLEEVTEAHVCNMRRAYYAMVSYVDDKVGALLDTLEATGLADNTVVVFTADHGDMLGERGLFFKMSFYEWSVRVPLIVCHPGSLPSRRVQQNVSLVDLFPTFLSLSSDGDAPDLVNPVDGHSLLGLLTGDGDGWPDTALSEYTGEGTAAPLFMVRRGPHKYVHGESDAPMLFDLEQDPDELTNLAGRTEHAATEAALRAEVYAQWSPARLAEEVVESQKRRLFLRDALNTGHHTPWDYQPFRDASRQYLRHEGDVQESYKTD